jgi:exonuclease SbcD
VTLKILHTSDWHIGKVLKGRSRVTEQIAVLAEIIEIAKAERPDLVLVAGDLFDNAAPAPDATKLVTRALSALRATGADVIAIAGNHDNGATLDALRPWADAAGITLRGTLNHPADHLIEGETSGGEAWRVAALPFVSQRHAVRATEMFSLTAAEATQTYADHVARLVATLAGEFGKDTINIFAAHLTVIGGTTGGGERDAHTIQSYAVPASIFPGGTHYVALGHLHRRQQVPAGCPVYYSGSPLAIDFGEEENLPSVTVVEVTASTSAKTRPVPVTSARRLRTVRGTLTELGKLAGDDESWLRVYVQEPPRAGLREAVQDLLPAAIDVRIDPQILADSLGPRPRESRAGRTPAQLFEEYLESKGHADPSVADLFARLYDEVSSA